MLKIEGELLETEVVHHNPVLGVNTIVPSRRQAKAAYDRLAKTIMFAEKDKDVILQDLDTLFRFIETR